MTARTIVPHALGPSSESLQGMNQRDGLLRWCSVLYGDCADAAVACSVAPTGLGSDAGTASHARAFAMLPTLPLLARKPVWRMRWKPFGSTCSSTRRMNSAGASVMVVYGHHR